MACLGTCSGCGYEREPHPNPARDVHTTGQSVSLCLVTATITRLPKLTMIPHHYWNNASLYKDVSVRVVVGITCVLSLLGALLIILSYCLFKDLRTSVRLILVHLSIMDMGSALAHLVGVSVYFDRFYIFLPAKYNSDGDIVFRNVSAHIDNLCRAQAFCTAYFNYGAFLWTASLAVYLYFRIVHLGPHQAKWVFRFSCVFSYLAPIPLVVWLLVQHYIGYSPYGAGGWCGLKIINPYTMERNIFVTAIGYDLLQDTTLVLAGVLFVSVHLHIRQEVRRFESQGNQCVI